ncbi:MAG: hypothetical protein RIS35_3066 [Pseudomonadota bacterium]
MQEPWYASAAALAREIRAGRLSAHEALEAFLARVDRLNPAINAIVVEDREGARARARAADAALARGEDWGPLHGVPITIKEANDRVGMPSTWGLPELAGNFPDQDAVAVERLEAAGAVIFGKTNVPVACSDFQSFNDVYGVTRNPWDLARVPGGSSGGAAAALAAGLTALELGSDIGGSIRNPAHFCGVFGHKPTWELVPMRGHGMGALRPADLAVVGPMARSAEDLELAMRLLAAPDELDARGRRVALEGLGKPVSALRVAVWADDPCAPVSAEVADRVREVGARFAAAGATVDERARPAFDAARAHETYLALLHTALTGSMTDAQFADQRARAARLAPEDRRWAAQLVRAQTMAHRDWILADEARHALRWAWHRFFQDWDLVLMPVMPTAAFAHDHRPVSKRSITVDGVDRHYYDCLFWAGLPTASLLPSTVVPTGVGREGLPIGVQLVGPAWGDLATIQAARWLETRGLAFVAPPDLDARVATT